MTAPPIQKSSVSLTIPLEAFERLIHDESHPKVTVIVPPRQPGHSPAEDETRVRNLIREAVRRLTDEGLDERTAEGMFAGLVDYIDHKGSDSTSSRALFVSEKQRTVLTVPLDLGEQVVVDADRFALSALAPLVRPKRFAMVALTRAGTAAAIATRYGWEELDLPEAPDGLAEITQFSDTERQLQSHSVGGSQAFHGHGTGESKQLADLHRYADLVETAVEKAAPEVRTHVVFGSPGLVAEYRKAVSNSAIDVIDVATNPSDEGFDQLHGRAISEMDEMLDTGREAIANYQRVAGSARGSTELDQIVPAARGGKVDTLIIDDDSTGHAIEAAVHETWLHGGAVYRTPQAEGVAAVLRY